MIFRIVFVIEMSTEVLRSLMDFAVIPDALLQYNRKVTFNPGVWFLTFEMWTVVLVDEGNENPQILAAGLLTADPLSRCHPQSLPAAHRSVQTFFFRNLMPNATEEFE